MIESEERGGADFGADYGSVWDALESAREGRAVREGRHWAQGAAASPREAPSSSTPWKVLPGGSAEADLHVDDPPPARVWRGIEEVLRREGRIRDPE